MTRGRSGRRQSTERQECPTGVDGPLPTGASAGLESGDPVERQALAVASEEFGHALDRLDDADPATVTALAAVASGVATGVVPSIDESVGPRAVAAALALFTDE